MFLLLLSYRHRPRLRVKSLQHCSCYSPVNLLSHSPKRKEQHATPCIRTRVSSAYLLNVHPSDFKATNLPFKQISQPALLRQVESLPNHHSDIEDPSQPTQYIASKSVQAPEAGPTNGEIPRPRGGEDTARKFDFQKSLQLLIEDRPNIRGAARSSLIRRIILEAFPQCSNHRCKHHNCRLDVLLGNCTHRF